MTTRLKRLLDIGVWIVAAGMITVQGMAEESCSANTVVVDNNAEQVEISASGSSYGKLSIVTGGNIDYFSVKGVFPNDDEACGVATPIESNLDYTGWIAQFDSDSSTPVLGSPFGSPSNRGKKTENFTMALYKSGTDSYLASNGSYDYGYNFLDAQEAENLYFYNNVWIKKIHQVSQQNGGGVLQAMGCKNCTFYNDSNGKLQHGSANNTILWLNNTVGQKLINFGYIDGSYSMAKIGGAQNSLVFNASGAKMSNTGSAPVLHFSDGGASSSHTITNRGVIGQDNLTSNAILANHYNQSNNLVSSYIENSYLFSSGKIETKSDTVLDYRYANTLADSTEANGRLLDITNAGKIVSQSGSIADFSGGFSVDLTNLGAMSSASTNALLNYSQSQHNVLLNHGVVKNTSDCQESPCGGAVALGGDNNSVSGSSLSLINTGTITGDQDTISTSGGFNNNGPIDQGLRLMNAGIIGAKDTPINTTESMFTTVFNTVSGQVTAKNANPAVEAQRASSLVVMNAGSIVNENRDSAIKIRSGTNHFLINAQSGSIAGFESDNIGMPILNSGRITVDNPNKRPAIPTLVDDLAVMPGAVVSGVKADEGAYPVEIVNYGAIAGTYSLMTDQVTMVAHQGSYQALRSDNGYSCPGTLYRSEAAQIDWADSNDACSSTSIPTWLLSNPNNVSGASVATKYDMSDTLNHVDNPYAEIVNPEGGESTGLKLATQTNPLRGYRIDNQGTINASTQESEAALNLDYTDVGVVNNGRGLTVSWASSCESNDCTNKTPAKPSCAAANEDGSCPVNAAVKSGETSNSKITNSLAPAISGAYATRLTIVNEPGAVISSLAQKTLDLYRSSAVSVDNQGGRIASLSLNAIAAPYSEYLQVNNATALLEDDTVQVGEISAASHAIALGLASDPAENDDFNDGVTLGFSGVKGNNIPGNIPGGYQQSSFASITNSANISAGNNTIYAPGAQFLSIANLNPVGAGGKELRDDSDNEVKGTIAANTGSYALNLQWVKYAQVYNEGLISAANSYTIGLDYSTGVAIDNAGVIEANGISAIEAQGATKLFLHNQPGASITSISQETVLLTGSKTVSIVNEGVMSGIANTIVNSKQDSEKESPTYIRIENGNKDGDAAEIVATNGSTAVRAYGQYNEVVNYPNATITAVGNTVQLGDYALLDNAGAIACSGDECTAVSMGDNATLILRGGEINGRTSLGNNGHVFDYTTQENAAAQVSTQASATATESSCTIAAQGVQVVKAGGGLVLSCNFIGGNNKLTLGGLSGDSVLRGGSIDLRDQAPLRSSFSDVTIAPGTVIQDTAWYVGPMATVRGLGSTTCGSGNSLTITGKTGPLVVGCLFTDVAVEDSMLSGLLAQGNNQTITLGEETSIGSAGLMVGGTNARVQLLNPTHNLNIGRASESGLLTNNTPLVTVGANAILDMPMSADIPFTLSTAGSTVPWAAVTNSLGHPIYYNFENACIQSTQDGCITAVNGAGLLEIRDEKLAMHTTRLAELLQSEATGWTHNVRYQDHQEQDDGHPHYNATIMSLAKRWDQGDKKWLIALDQDNTHIRDNFNVSQTTLSVGMQKPWKKHTTWQALAGLSREQTTRITQEIPEASSYDQASFYAGFVGVGAGVTKAVNSTVQVGGDLGLIHEMVASYEESRYGWDTNHLTLLKPEAYARLAYRLANGIRLDHELRSFYATMVGGDSQTFYVLGNAQTHDYRNTDTWTLQYSLGAEVTKRMRVAASAAWSNQDFTQIGLSVQMN